MFERQDRNEFELTPSKATNTSTMSVGWLLYFVFNLHNAEHGAVLWLPPTHSSSQLEAPKIQVLHWRWAGRGISKAKTPPCASTAESHMVKPSLVAAEGAELRQGGFSQTQAAL